MNDYAGGVGADQCSLPVTARQGQWFCAGQSQTGAALPPADTAPDTTDGGHCTTKGCWYLSDHAHADSNMAGSFGYGSTGLGDTYMSANQVLSGSTMTANTIQFNATVGVKDLHGTGQMVIGPKSGVGTFLDDTYNLSSGPTVLPANTTYRPFGGTYSARDDSSVNHAVVIEVSWYYGAYDGYWYMYQKSLIARDPDNNNTYNFDTPTYLYADSAIGGYTD